MSTTYDPADLVLLTSGFASRQSVTLSHAEELEKVAEMLHRLYLEVRDEWTAVWGYEVAEPLGFWIGGVMAEAWPDAEAIERHARHLLAEAA